MKQTNTNISLATKINENAIIYELQIASYLFGSNFEEIITNRKLRVALNFTSSHKNFFKM